MTLHDDEVSAIARQLSDKMLKEAEAKRVFKEALNEWLDKKFLEFSKSLTMAFIVILFGAFVSFVMWSQGYHK